MECRVLGSLEVVTSDGDIVRLASVAQRRLAGILLTSPGSVVTADRLSDVLGVSSGGLHTAISRLRKSLVADVLTTEPPGYALRGVDVDAVGFKDQLMLAPQADPDRRIDILTSALDLWRGPAFLEFADEEWARGPAAQLSELRAMATEDLTESMLTVGRYADAVAVLVEHIDRHPLRDRPRGLLIRSLAAQGRQSEALRSYRAYRTFLGEEIGTEPSVDLQLIARKIAAGWHDEHEPTIGGGAPDPARRRPQHHNLRPENNGFVDRHEVDHVVTLIDSHRLVTIVGPGGIGKSRTAEAAGRRLGERVEHGDTTQWDDGVWVVDLAPLRSNTAEIADVVVEALGLRRQPGHSATGTVIEFLRHRSSVLILDNCEHVLDAARAFATQVISTCSAVTLLATSRTRLGLDAERVADLGPMSTLESRQLFQTRVAECGAGPFLAADADALCAMLDHYPLAIELAAGRCRALTASELRDRLGSHPGLLRATSGAANARHASLDAALSWSLAELDSTTRGVLDRAATIISDFDLAAAESILSTADVAPSDVLDSLDVLVEHHLLRRDHRRARYRILEPIRQVVGPASAGDEELALRRSRYYLALMTEISDGLVGPDEAFWLARLGDELPNVRDAVERAIERSEWSPIESMMRKMPLAVENHVFIDAADWADRMLRAANGDPTRFPATALTAASGMRHMERPDECDALLNRLERDGIDPAFTSMLCFVRKMQQLNSGNSAAATEWADRCRTAAVADGDALMAAMGSMQLAAADATGNPTLRAFARMNEYMFMEPELRAQARSMMEECNSAAVTSTNAYALSGSELLLGATLIRAGETRRGAAKMASGMERTLQLRIPALVWNAVESVANSLVTAGEPFNARLLWAAVDSNDRSPVSRTVKDSSLVSTVDHALTVADTDRANREGSTLTMDAAATLARETLEKLASEPPAGSII